MIDFILNDNDHCRSKLPADQGREICEKTSTTTTHNIIHHIAPLRNKLTIDFSISQNHTNTKAEYMLKLIFWNTQKKTDQSTLDALTEIVNDSLIANGKKINADILLCIAEPGKIDSDAILKRLNSNKKLKWWKYQSLKNRFLVFGSIPQDSIEFSKTEIARCIPCSINRNTGKKILNFDIWFVHLLSPAFAWSPTAKNRAQAAFLRQKVEDRESIRQPEGTILIGDFNMVPYGNSMLETSALNATPCSFTADSGPVETEDGKYIKFFYNPMWELLGSWSNTPGTFYRKEKEIAVRWHIIDHVLVRPPLIKSIEPETLRILTSAGSIPLTNGNGGMAKISDHLPITITLNI